VIFIISGPGGVGKGTVVARLLQLDPTLWLSRSWTTRARRPGELDQAYVFADRAEFMARVAAGGFLEWTEFKGNGHLYGTPTLVGPPGRDVVLEIELDGATQVKRSHPDAKLIFIAPPSDDVLAGRLRQRGDSEENVKRRLDTAVEEIPLGRRLADYVVVNDDIERAAGELAGIIEGSRHIQGS
jgi:guanylate kinase